MGGRTTNPLTVVMPVRIASVVAVPLAIGGVSGAAAGSTAALTWGQAGPFFWIPMVLMLGGSSTGSGLPHESAETPVDVSTPADPNPCPPNDQTCLFTGVPSKPSAGGDSADAALSDLTAGGRATASQLDEFGAAQGWARSQTATGPVKYTDPNGVVRLTIKRGSDRAPGSGSPHVELRNVDGFRVDSVGNLVTRRSPGNHTPIVWDW